MKIIPPRLFVLPGILLLSSVVKLGTALPQPAAPTDLVGIKSGTVKQAADKLANPAPKIEKPVFENPTHDKLAQFVEKMVDKVVDKMPAPAAPGPPHVSPNEETLKALDVVKTYPEFFTPKPAWTDLELKYPDKTERPYPDHRKVKAKQLKDLETQPRAKTFEELKSWMDKLETPEDVVLQKGPKLKNAPLRDRLSNWFEQHMPPQRVNPDEGWIGPHPLIPPDKPPPKLPAWPPEDRWYGTQKIPPGLPEPDFPAVLSPQPDGPSLAGTRIEQPAGVNNLKGDLTESGGPRVIEEQINTPKEIEKPALPPQQPAKPQPAKPQIKQPVQAEKPALPPQEPVKPEPAKPQIKQPKQVEKPALPPQEPVKPRPAKPQIKQPVQVEKPALPPQEPARPQPAKPQPAKPQIEQPMQVEKAALAPQIKQPIEAEKPAVPPQKPTKPQPAKPQIKQPIQAEKPALLPQEPVQHPPATPQIERPNQEPYASSEDSESKSSSKESGGSSEDTLYRDPSPNHEAPNPIDQNPPVLENLPPGQEATPPGVHPQEVTPPEIPSSDIPPQEVTPPEIPSAEVPPQVITPPEISPPEVPAPEVPAPWESRPEFKDMHIPSGPLGVDPNKIPPSHPGTELELPPDSIPSLSDSLASEGIHSTGRYVGADFVNGILPAELMKVDESGAALIKLAAARAAAEGAVSIGKSGVKLLGSAGPVAAGVVMIGGALVAICDLVKSAKDDRVTRSTGNYTVDINGDGRQEYVVLLHTLMSPNGTMNQKNILFDRHETGQGIWIDHHVGGVQWSTKGWHQPRDGEVLAATIFRTVVENRPLYKDLMNADQMWENKFYQVKDILDHHGGYKLEMDWLKLTFKYPKCETARDITIKYKASKKLEIVGDLDGDCHDEQLIQNEPKDEKADDRLQLSHICDKWRNDDLGYRLFHKSKRFCDVAGQDKFRYWDRRTYIHDANYDPGIQSGLIPGQTPNSESWQWDP